MLGYLKWLTIVMCKWTAQFSEVEANLSLRVQNLDQFKIILPLAKRNTLPRVSKLQAEEIFKDAKTFGLKMRIQTCLMFWNSSKEFPTRMISSTYTNNATKDDLADLRNKV